MTAVWPGSLPQDVFVPGYEERLPETALRTSMDAGPAKVRRRFTAGVTQLAVTVPLTRAQAALLEAFHDQTLAGGALPFEWVHPRALRPVWLRFVEPPSIAPEPGAKWWRAECMLEILPEGPASALDLHYGPAAAVELDGAGRVSRWGDASGMGRPAVQPDPAARAFLVADGLGGKPCLRFGPERHFYYIVNMAGLARNLGALFLALVFRPQSIAETVSVFELAAGDGDLDARVMVRLHPSGEIILGGKRRDHDAVREVFAGWWVPGQPIIVSGLWHWSRGVLRAWRNGQHTAEDPGFCGPGRTSDTDSSLMFVDSDAWAFLGDLGEVRLMRRPPSAAEIAAVHQALSQDWGVPLA